MNKEQDTLMSLDLAVFKLRLQQREVLMCRGTWNNAEGSMLKLSVAFQNGIRVEAISN